MNKVECELDLFHFRVMNICFVSAYFLFVWPNSNNSDKMFSLSFSFQICFEFMTSEWTQQQQKTRRHIGRHCQNE